MIPLLKSLIHLGCTSVVGLKPIWYLRVSVTMFIYWRVKRKFWRRLLHGFFCGQFNIRDGCFISLRCLGTLRSYQSYNLGQFCYWPFLSAILENPLLGSNSGSLGKTWESYLKSQAQFLCSYPKIIGCVVYANGTMYIHKYIPMWNLGMLWVKQMISAHNKLYILATHMCNLLSTTKSNIMK